MQILRIVIIFLCLLLLLRIFSLRGRRGHTAWKTLERFRYAHRGLHDLNAGIPENSLAAFRRAVEHGFGAELDVHLLADGTLAVFHDSDLRRMTGRSGFLEELTAEKLCEYRLGGTGEMIPQLCEVLPLFEEAKLPLIVELKSFRGNFAALTERTLAELDKYELAYCVESFDPRCIAWLRKHRGDVVRGQLSCDFSETPSPDRLVKKLVTGLWSNLITVPDFVAYRFEDRGIPALRFCRALYGVHAVHWTIRSRADMQQAEREGALVIFEQFIP